MENRRHLMVGTPAGTLNTITPCAACKLLKRRCAEECPFSPYFPPHEPHKFAAIHKVFGASNASKLLMEVPENQRADAANCMVLEANLRLGDPVYGCIGAISALQQQNQSLQAEVNALRTELLKYKLREAEATTSNIIPSTNTHHAAAFISSGVVSLATPSPFLNPPPPPLPAPRSFVVSSSSSTSISPLFTQPTGTMGYSSINLSDNVSYFG